MLRLYIGDVELVVVGQVDVGSDLVEHHRHAFLNLEPTSYSGLVGSVLELEYQ